MGIPAPANLAASGTPPAGDQANYVLSGSFTAVGPGVIGSIWGPMNVSIWASTNVTLTTTLGSTSATVSAAGTIAKGDAINSANVPRGTTVAAISGTTVTLSAAATATGGDTAAIFTGAAQVYVGNVQLERSFDGGSTWLPCNIGGGGQLAQWSAGTPVSITFGEPERGVLYRLNCLAWTSGTISYRISTTGGAALSLSVPSVI